MPDGAGRRRNFGLALRVMARSVLPGPTTREAPAALLRVAVRYNRIERRVLSHADRGGSQRVACRNRQKLRIRVEGLEVYFALEAVIRELRKQHRAARKPVQAPCGKRRSGFISASAKLQ